jgi:hypothetical protein
VSKLVSEMQWNIIGRNFLIDPQRKNNILFNQVSMFDKEGKCLETCSRTNPRCLKIEKNKESVKFSVRISENRNFHMDLDEIKGVSPILIFTSVVYPNNMNHMRVKTTTMNLVFKKETICRMKLSKSFANSVIWAAFIFKDNGWIFTPIDEATDFVSFNKLEKRMEEIVIDLKNQYFIK